MTLKEQATANVIAVRGSDDRPGFDACVDAEMERLWQKQQEAIAKLVEALKKYTAEEHVGTKKWNHGRTARETLKSIGIV